MKIVSQLLTKYRIPRHQAECFALHNSTATECSTCSYYDQCHMIAHHEEVSRLEAQASMDSFDKYIDVKYNCNESEVG